MAAEKALRYEGGRSLTFRDASGARRTVRHGHHFTVDAATAKILLEDPQVMAADGPTVPRETTPPQVSSDGHRPPEVTEGQQIDVAKANKKALLEYAGLLGLTIATSTKVGDVRASIEAELARRAELKAPLVDEAAAAAAAASDSGEGDEGGSKLADDPDATATGEAGTPPDSSSSTGAITLGDLPDSAKVKG
jgi:hypothetical protein